MCHQLDQTRIDQDACGDGIKDAIDNQGGLGFGRVGVPDAETDGDGDGCAEAIGQSKDIWSPPSVLGPGGDGEPRAKTKTFKGLVEDENDKEGVEFFAGDSQGQANEDTVEDDAKLQYKDGRHLSLVVFEAGEGLGLLDVVVFPGVAEVIFPGDVGAVLSGGRGFGGVVGSVFIWVGGSDRGHLVVLGRSVGGVVVSMAMSIAETAISHDHEFDEEQDEDGDQNDTLDPGILGDGSGETFVGQSFFGRAEEMDEGGCEDDARTEIFADEKDPVGSAQALVSVSKDGEDSAEGGSDPDDEDGGYAQTHATVILIAGRTDGGRLIGFLLASDELDEGFHVGHEGDNVLGRRVLG